MIVTNICHQHRCRTATKNCFKIDWTFCWQLNIDNIGITNISSQIFIGSMNFKENILATTMIRMMFFRKFIIWISNFWNTGVYESLDGSSWLLGRWWTADRVRGRPLDSDQNHTFQRCIFGNTKNFSIRIDFCCGRKFSRNNSPHFKSFNIFINCNLSQKSHFEIK